MSSNRETWEEPDLVRKWFSWLLDRTWNPIIWTEISKRNRIGRLKCPSRLWRMLLPDLFHLLLVNLLIETFGKEQSRRDLSPSVETKVKHQLSLVGWFDCKQELWQPFLNWRACRMLLSLFESLNRPLGESIARRVVRSSRGVSDSIHWQEGFKLLTGECRAVVCEGAVNE